MLDEDRGALPYRLIHGEALVTVATWALEQAEVEIVDQRVPWSELADRGVPLVLHDALCPMTPPEFLADCVAQAASGHPVIGVRPVTDSVKRLVEGQVGPTVDRDRLMGVCSPVVLPPDVVADLPDGPPTTDLVALARWLRERYADTTLLEAPVAARRVASGEDLRVLAAITAP